MSASFGPWEHDFYAWYPFLRWFVMRMAQRATALCTLRPRRPLKEPLRKWTACCWMTEKCKCTFLALSQTWLALGWRKIAERTSQLWLYWLTDLIWNWSVWRGWLSDITFSFLDELLLKATFWKKCWCLFLYCLIYVCVKIACKYYCILTDVVQSTIPGVKLCSRRVTVNNSIISHH